MKFVFDDGGRSAAGYVGETSDCVARAIAIAARLSYLSVYQKINEISKSEKTGKRKCGISSATTGVYKYTYKKLLEHLGFRFVATMGIGTGCKVHLRENELPKGRIICNVSRHMVAVIDGVIHDTHDCSRNGMRCVYGYWIR